MGCEAELNRGHHRFLDAVASSRQHSRRPRIARVGDGGLVYHVLNRGNGRSTVFHDEHDYAAFFQLLGEAALPEEQSKSIRILEAARKHS